MSIMPTISFKKESQHKYHNEIFSILMEKGVFYVVKKKFFLIPLSIRMVGFSLFIFIL